MITPNNRQLLSLKDPANINECWIKSTDYSFISTATESEIIIACAKINNLCNRKFNRQTSDLVFHNSELPPVSYTTFILDNLPAVEIVDVYIQVLDTFNLISNQYNQLIQDTGVLSIVPLPEIYPPVNFTPMYYSKYNTWIRYSSGFLTNADIGNATLEAKYEKVPELVKYATALMVKYMKSLQDLDGSVESFSTQTYSQKNAIPQNNALLLEINDLLKDYKITKFI
jgi:hypothetical protein